MNEYKLGGILLTIGGIIMLLTIFFEYQIGWIGVERPPDDVPQYMFENWKDLSSIWTWQAFSHVITTLSYLVLLKQSKGIFSLFWSILALCGVLLIVSMYLTLGSYYPSLEVYSSKPELFNTIRGGIRTLYSTAQMGGLFLTVIFIIETFRKNGVVYRWLGISVLVLVILSIVIGAVTSIPIKVIGATSFLIPIILGIGYWKNHTKLTVANKWEMGSKYSIRRMTATGRKQSFDRCDQT